MYLAIALLASLFVIITFFTSFRFFIIPSSFTAFLFFTLAFLLALVLGIETFFSSSKS